jgi:excisionase family DNA binding protein
MPPKGRKPTPSLLDIQAGEILTTEDVARVLKVSQRTVQRLIESEAIKAFQVGHQRRILGRELYSFCGYASATALPCNPVNVATV